MPRKYFVTGANGFLGGRLVRRLRQRGDSVVCLVRGGPRRAQDLVAAGCEVIDGDLSNPEFLARAMSGCDGLFHLAAMYKIGKIDKKAMYEANVTGTKNVLNAMNAASIPFCVYTSSLAVNGDSRGRILDETHTPLAKDCLSYYDLTKHLAHHQVAMPMVRAGSRIAIVMPGGVYGPGDTSMLQTTIEQVISRKLPALPKSSGICLTHVDDIVDGHILAMDKAVPGEFILGSDAVLSVDFARKIAQWAGVPLTKRRLARGLLKCLSCFMGKLCCCCPFAPTMHPEALKILTGTYWGTCTRAQRELGYKPRSLDEGLAQLMVHELRQRGMTASSELLEAARQADANAPHMLGRELPPLPSHI